MKKTKGVWKFPVTIVLMISIIFMTSGCSGEMNNIFSVDPERIESQSDSSLEREILSRIFVKQEEKALCDYMGCSIEDVIREFGDDYKNYDPGGEVRMYWYDQERNGIGFGVSVVGSGTVLALNCKNGSGGLLTKDGLRGDMSLAEIQSFQKKHGISISDPVYEEDEMEGKICYWMEFVYDGKNFSYTWPVGKEVQSTDVPDELLIMAEPDFENEEVTEEETVEETKDVSKTTPSGDDWNDFIRNAEYNKYITLHGGDHLSYAEYDLDGDGKTELLFEECDYGDFFYTWIFVKKGGSIYVAQESKEEDENYGCGEYQFLPDRMEIVGNPLTRPYYKNGSMHFYQLKNGELEYKYSIVQDDGRFYKWDRDKELPISPSEIQIYTDYKGIIQFDWKRI